MKMKNNLKKQSSLERSPLRSGSVPKNMQHYGKPITLVQSLSIKPFKMMQLEPKSIHSRTTLLNTIKEESEITKNKKRKTPCKKNKFCQKNKLKIQKSNDSPKKKKAKSVDKEKNKKINYSLCLKQLKPLNLQEQKRIFFAKEGSYNPIFIYPNILDFSEEQYKQIKHFESPNEEFIELALKIMQKGLKTKQKEQTKLTIEQTSKQFDAYIKLLNIGSQLTYQFVQNTISSTSVVHNNIDGISRVLIGLPIRYTSSTIKGVLNHEIGTHFLRKINDRLQKWHKQRKKYELQDYLQTEEGLAAINQLLPLVQNNNNLKNQFQFVSSQSHQSNASQGLRKSVCHKKLQNRADYQIPLLKRAALLYYGCYLASRLSFVDLFSALKRFQPETEQRWKECVRMKRGIAHTCNPGGMYKDQIYLMGAVNILRNRATIDFKILYSGKISVTDCQKINQKNYFRTEGVKLPPFIQNIFQYKRALDLIADANQIK